MNTLSDIKIIITGNYRFVFREPQYTFVNPVTLSRVRREDKYFHPGDRPFLPTHFSKSGVTLDTPIQLMSRYYRLIVISCYHLR